MGTCRDFALMLCGLLRHRGVPARIRCGFAAYFTTPWEDHWVCEYWHAAHQAWRLCDAQLDPVLRRHFGIGFDPTDVPRAMFLTADAAWASCRGGGADPDLFGHGSVTGAWFMKVNLIRDHYVLHGRETSPWDAWRAAPAALRAVTEEDAAALDALAAGTARIFRERAPDWIR